MSSQEIVYPEMASSHSSPVHQPCSSPPQPPQPLRRQRQPRIHQQQIELNSFFAGGDARQPSKRPRPFTTNNSCFGTCPLCHISFPWYKLEHHAATSCQGRSDNESNNNNCKEECVIASDQRLHTEEDTVGAWPTPTTEGMKNTIIHPSNSIHGMVSQRQVSKDPITATSLTMASTPTFAAVHNYKYYDLPPVYNDYGPSAAPRFVSVSRPHHSREEEEEETTIAEDVGGSSGRTGVESLAFQWSKPREALGGGLLCNWRDRRVDSPEHA